MCLITFQEKPLTAATDITVCKVFKGVNGLESFYRGFQYKEGALNVSDIKCNTVSFLTSPTARVKEVYEGFHAYENLSAAFAVAAFKNDYPDICVRRATIPAGSLYYEDRGCIVSNQIIINEVIPSI